ncbi:MAG: hypothetical protein ABSF33_00700 [Acidimicrobiales bacterium]
MHPFLGHRPLHRRQVATTQWGVGAGLSLGSITLSRRYRTRALGGRDYRAWGIALGALAWIGFMAAHGAGLLQATAIFAAVDALTWGQAVGALVPTEDGLEFSTISVATSAALLVLVGMLLVEVRLTGAFFWVFVAVGALSLVIQIMSFVIQIVSFQAKNAPPQSVPSIIGGRIVMEER